MKPKMIVTIPPYAPFIEEITKHPAVSGLRLNTVMPLNETKEEALKRIKDITDKYKKELFIDLKSRQLRIKSFGVPPFTEIELSHKISLDLPATAYFTDGKQKATILQIKDGNKLIMQEGPKRVVGPGESVNIHSSNLKIEGLLTDTDKEYIEAGNKTGIQNYMLSFVEQKEDINQIKKYTDANIIAKIESKKGMNYVINEFQNEATLMIARGDLYVELDKPHHIIRASERILEKDNNAIAASRIFSSLSESYEPSCADIGDTDNLLRMGYRKLMIGDDICMKRESAVSALNLFEAMTYKYV